MSPWWREQRLPREDEEDGTGSAERHEAAQDSRTWASRKLRLCPQSQEGACSGKAAKSEQSSPKVSADSRVEMAEDHLGLPTDPWRCFKQGSLYPSAAAVASLGTREVERRPCAQSSSAGCRQAPYLLCPLLHLQTL